MRARWFHRVGLRLIPALCSLARDAGAQLAQFTEATTITAMVVNVSFIPPPTCACCDGGVSSTPIRVGVPLVEPLGNNLRAGYDFVVAYINEVRFGLCINGQRHFIDIQHVGTESSDNAAEAAQYLLDTQGVNLLLGPSTEVSNQEALNAARDHRAIASNLFLVGLASSDRVWLDGTTKTTQSDSTTENAFAHLSLPNMRLRTIFRMHRNLIQILAREPKVVAIVTTPTGSQQQLQDEQSMLVEMCDAVPALSREFFMQPVDTIRVVRGTVNLFAEALLTAKGHKADMVIACLSFDHCVDFVEAAVMTDMNFYSVVLPDCAVSPEFAKQVGLSSQFILASALWAPELESEFPFGATNADFVKMYRQLTGITPSYQVAIGASIASSLAHALENANSTEPDVVANAMRTHFWKTIYGPASFTGGIKQMNMSDKVFQRLPGSDELQLVGTPAESLRQQAPMFWPKPGWSDVRCFADLPAATNYSAIWGIDDNITIFPRDALLSKHGSAPNTSRLNPENAAAAAYYAAYVVGLHETLWLDRASAAYVEAQTFQLSAGYWAEVADALRIVIYMVFSGQTAWYKQVAAEAAVAHLQKTFDTTNLDPEWVCSPCPIGRLRQWVQSGLERNYSCVPCEGSSSVHEIIDPTLQPSTSLDGINRQCMPACGPGWSKDLSTGSCSICPAGSIGVDGLACHACEEGRYSGSPGQTACEDCPSGHYANTTNATECTSCLQGQEVLISAMGYGLGCRDCLQGTYAATAGTQTCRLCSLGRTGANLTGSSECSSCPPGRYSYRNATLCAPCPVGTYQPSPNSGSCVDGEEGATFNTEGLEKGENKNGYWLEHHLDEQGREVVDWQVCDAVPSGCLENEDCGKGSTGVHCNSCLPGYSHTLLVDASSACFKCPPILLNLIGSLVCIAIFFLIAVFMAQSSAIAIRKPEAVHLLLLKTYVKYTAFAGTVAYILGEIIVDRRPVFGAGLLTVFSYSLLPFIMMGNCFFNISETPFVSVRCLVQFMLPRKYADAVPVEVLDCSHWEWMTDELAPAREALEQFQYQVELYTSVLWLISPVLAVMLLMCISYILVSWDLWRRREFYGNASKFYQILFQKGVEAVHKDYSSRDILVYCREYHYKFMGVWWPVPHFQVEQKSFVHLASPMIFVRETKPVILSIYVLAHAAVIAGVTATTRCRYFGEEEGPQQIFMANMIDCPREESPLLWLSVGGFLIWGLCAPLGILALLYKRKKRMATDPGTKSEYSIMFSGYKQQFWWWEIVSFLFQTLAICVPSFRVGSGKQMNEVLLAGGLVYAAVHLIAQPFDERREGILSRVNKEFMTIWIGSCIVVEFLGSIRDAQTTVAGQVQDTEVAPRVSGVLCMLCLTVCHVAFIGTVLNRVYRQVLHSYMSDIYGSTGQHGFDHLDDDLAALAEVSGLRTRIREMMLRQYRDHCRNAPYICLDASSGWAVLCGSRADRRAVPIVSRGRTWAASGGRPLLSQAPRGPDDPVTCPASAAQKASLSNALMSCTEDLAEKMRGAVFSVSLLEFVIRAAFALARQKEHFVEEADAHASGEDYEHGDFFVGMASANVSRWKSYARNKFRNLSDRRPASQRAEKRVAKAFTFEPLGNSSGPVDFEDGSPRTSMKLQSTVTRFCYQLEEAMYENRRFWHSVSKSAFRDIAQAQSGDDLAVGATLSRESNASRTSEDSDADPFQMGRSAPNLTEGDTELSGRISRALRSRHRLRSAAEKTMVKVKSEDLMSQRLEVLTIQMFGNSIYTKGVALEKFEIALMDLENCPAPMLVKWLDTFERYWVRHNQQVLHQLHLATGKVSDQWAQTGQVADTTYPPQGDATEHREEDPGAIIDVGMGVVSAELLAARGASEVFKNCLSNYQNQFLAKKTAAQSSEAIVEEPETREVGVQTTVNVAFPPSHNIGAASQNTPTALVQKSAKAFQEATLARWARLVLLLGKFNVQSFPPLPLATVNAMLASRRAKLEHGTHAELMEQQMLLEREEAELKQVQRDLEKAADDAKPSTVFGYLLGARRDEVSPSELSRPSEVHA